MKEGNALFNNALNTFSLQLYCVRHMVKDHLDSERGNLPQPVHGLLRLAAKDILYTPSHRQDSVYHNLCFQTSHGALAGTRDSSMGPPWGIETTTVRSMSTCSTQRCLVVTLDCCKVKYCTYGHLRRLGLNCALKILKWAILLSKICIL